MRLKTLIFTYYKNERYGRDISVMHTHTRIHTHTYVL